MPEDNNLLLKCQGEANCPPRIYSRKKEKNIFRHIKIKEFTVHIFLERITQRCTVARRLKPEKNDKNPKNTVSIKTGKIY